MKHKKILYFIIIIIIITISVIYFFPKKEKFQIEATETNIPQHENIVVSVPEKQTPQNSVTTANQYVITKNFDIIPKDPKSNKRIVLITIDDGPSSQALGMMKILEAHNAKAIFFINGMHYKANPGVLEAEAKAGFPIGNHTWSHINLKNTKNTTLVDEEIISNSDLIKKITLSAPRFFRNPFGVSSAYSKELIKKDNMIAMNWSDAAKDWEKTARDEKVFIKNVTDGLHPGSIILIHEHPWSLKNLDALLTTIEKLGYTFADPNNIVE